MGIKSFSELGNKSNSGIELMMDSEMEMKRDSEIVGSLEVSG